MKRIIVDKYGSEDVLRLKDSDLPRPAVGEILIRLHAAGVNPVDSYRRAGSQGYTPDLPFCPGFEGAGEILAIGVDTPADAGNSPDAGFDFRIGDRVYVGWSKSGTYGQWCIADQSQVFPLPAALSWEEGAGLFVNYFTAYRALVLRGAAAPGEKVLVHGASGGVGLAAMQWCAFLGNPAWGTAGSPEGLELVGRWSPRGTADHSKPGYENSLKGESGGFDIILEMRADVNLERDLDMLAPGGRVMVIGSKGSIEITPRRTMGIEGDIRGVVLFRNSPAENLTIHRELEKGIASMDIRPVIRETYPLERAADAHRDLFAGPAAGKRVLLCDEFDE